MNRRQGDLRIGTSGFQYDHWRGIFYPRDIPKKRWFDYYARHFDTVEINNTFYRLPEVHTFEAWRDQAPAGFLYALKFSRYASHLKRLKDPQGPITQFVERAVHLGDYLGPILVQLPPRWKVNAKRLTAFLDEAPQQYRWAIEFRDSSWLCEEIFGILETYQATLCIHDMLPDHPQQITSRWIYLRFHGDHYTGNYSHQFLTSQAQRVREYLLEGLDVYAYFNNDVCGYALRNAHDLKRYVQET